LENNNERFYPVKDASGKNRALFLQYKQIDNPITTFIGRLGQYVYLDMHQVISSSMAIAEKFLKENTL
jgi:UDP-galactopyranose mutase